MPVISPPPLGNAPWPGLTGMDALVSKGGPGSCFVLWGVSLFSSSPCGTGKIPPPGGLQLSLQVGPSAEAAQSSRPPRPRCLSTPTPQPPEFPLYHIERSRRKL